MKQPLLLLSLLPFFPAFSQDLIITGVIDGPLTGGTPKAIEFYATADIPDLSLYAFGSANNGGGSDGPEFKDFTGSLNSGDFIYVSEESTEFNNFFGFMPTYASSFASINGNDAIELFYDATGDFTGSEVVIDVFGDINVDGSGEPWDYEDGWAYRSNNTGPDGSTFTIANWSFSGKNALDGETTNASATSPFPAQTFSVIPTDVSPPSWTSGYPFLINYTNTSFDIIGQINEAGTVYFVVLLDGSTAPSSAEVKAGTGSAGASTATNGFNAAALTTDVTLSISGLSSGTDYNVYVVAEDDETNPNLQASPVRLDFPIKVAITEFINDPDVDASEEWIELYNYGANAVDLTGWTISDEDNDNSSIGSLTIAAAGFVILAKSKTTFETQWLAGVSDPRVVEINIQLANGDDEIILSDNNDNLIWSLAYGNDETTRRATFLDINEDGTTRSYGSKTSPGVNRDGNDANGSLGYESNDNTTDPSAYTSTTGDVGSPLLGNHVALPIILASFNGWASDNIARLEWQTFSELNNERFDIEKSLNGNHFTLVGSLAGNGTSETIITYNFEDFHFYQSAFYRLKQVDFDGKAEYHPSIFIEKNEKSEIAIFPNPIKADVILKCPAASFQLSVINSIGQLILDQNTTKLKAEEAILKLKPGLYILRIYSDDLDYTTTLIRQ
ncbi:MAG: lamin tail domain-containing protein [Cyclobacteriaceae bacterium]